VHSRTSTMRVPTLHPPPPPGVVVELEAPFQLVLLLTIEPPLGHQVPATMSERRAEVVKKLVTCSDAAVPITTFLSNGNLLKQLRQDRQQNLSFLAEHNVGEADIEALYTYAKFQFDCGNYSGEMIFDWFVLRLAREVI
jgi:hypothetical protein